ncbi:DUF6056 family protein [Selenomonas ruminantium]|uniref:DUF3329 domain-containing protein n=1 Tax=Selenomonas ruminantium TaxID=971 RepID=UPI0015690670|nr:DUF6056 family protein [Selenomonas ruminantium]
MEVWADRLYGLWQALWQRLNWQQLLFFGAGVFLWRNILMPMVGDDYSYAFIWDGAHAGNLMDGIGPRQRITSLTDIVASQWSHYFTWGGRVPALFAVQFFAWQRSAHDFLFAFVNTAFFVLLVFVLFWLAAGRIEHLRKSKAGLLWLLLGLFFAIPSYIYTMVWLTGACVYLWTAVVECAFLLPYALAYWRDDLPLNKSGWAMPVMALLGLLAGWSVEPGAIVTLLITLAFLVMFYRQKKLQSWQLVGLGFFMVGLLLLMLAPGSMERLRLMQELAPEYTMPPELLWTPIMFLYNFVEGFVPVFLGELPLWILVVLCLRYGQCSREWKRYILVFAAGGMLVLCAMMFSPDFRAHGAYHSVIFLLVASTAALRAIMPQAAMQCRQVPKIRLGVSLLGFTAIASWLLSTVMCLILETSYSQQWAEREKIVNEHRQDDLIVVPAIELPGHLDKITGNRSVTETILTFGADLENDPRDNRSNMYAQYHGVKGVVIDKQIDWGKYGEANEW